VKRALLTVFFVFLTAFILLFSFHKDKKKSPELGKKSSVTAKNESRVFSAPEPAKMMNESESDQNAGVVSANEVATSDEIPNETIERFFSEIPGKKDLKSVSNVHETPVAVLKAGEYLANMREYFNKFPQPRAVEMGFYLKCSQQTDFFESIRAVCAARLSEQYFEATGHQISAELFDKRIDSLRRKINL
jgi:hypothetical protein